MHAPPHGARSLRAFARRAVRNACNARVHARGACAHAVLVTGTTSVPTGTTSVPTWDHQRSNWDHHRSNMGPPFQHEAPRLCQSSRRSAPQAPTVTSSSSFLTRSRSSGISLVKSESNLRRRRGGGRTSACMWATLAGGKGEEEEGCPRIIPGTNRPSCVGGRICGGGGGARRAAGGGGGGARGRGARGGRRAPPPPARPRPRITPGTNRPYWVGGLNWAPPPPPPTAGPPAAARAAWPGASWLPPPPAPPGPSWRARCSIPRSVMNQKGGAKRR